MKRPRIPRLVFFVLLSTVLAGIAFFIFKRSVWVPDQQAGNRHMSFPAKDRLVFIAVGDTGTGDAMQYATAEAMEAHCQKIGGIDGLLLLGDNFYKSGVSSVDDSQWQQKMEVPLGGSCLKKAPIFPVLGNHDYKGNAGAQIAYSHVNPRWKMPSRFYTIDYAPLLRIVAFDTGFPDFCLLPDTCSVDYLRRELAEAQQTWRLVIGHHPLRTASTKGFSHSGSLFGLLLRPVICGKADLYLAGHAHHLEYSRLPECATGFIISGAGGAELYPINNPPPEGVEFVQSTYGFVQLTVTPESLTSDFISQRGELLHTNIAKR